MNTMKKYASIFSFVILSFSAIKSDITIVNNTDNKVKIAMKQDANVSPFEFDLEPRAKHVQKSSSSYMPDNAKDVCIKTIVVKETHHEEDYNNKKITYTVLDRNIPKGKHSLNKCREQNFALVEKDGELQMLSYSPRR
jgi:hypothetical protein